MTQSASGTFNPELASGAESADAKTGRCHSYGRQRGRKRWSGVEIAAMVGGFIVFWPLGLLALFLKLWNGEMWQGASEGTLPFSGWFSQKPSTPSASSFKGFGFGGFQAPSSGNTAFDAYRREQLARLEEERRKLEDEQREFKAYLQRLAEARDKDEFDRFMAERTAPKPASE